MPPAAPKRVVAGMFVRTPNMEISTREADTCVLITHPGRKEVMRSEMSYDDLIELAYVISCVTSLAEQ